MLENPTQEIKDGLFHHYLDLAKSSNIPRNFYLASAQVIGRIAPDRTAAFRESHPGVRNDLPALEVMEELVKPRFRNLSDASYALTFGQTIASAKLWITLNTEDTPIADRVNLANNELSRLNKKLCQSLNNPQNMPIEAPKGEPDLLQEIAQAQKECDLANALRVLYDRSVASVLYTAGVRLEARTLERQAQKRVETHLESYYASAEAVERINKISFP